MLGMLVGFFNAVVAVRRWHTQEAAPPPLVLAHSHGAVFPAVPGGSVDLTRTRDRVRPSLLDIIYLFLCGYSFCLNLLVKSVR